jgi:ketosteroid isomerase-like protein
VATNSKVFVTLAGVAAFACAAPQRAHSNEQALLAADAQFDGDVAQRGLDAWLSWFEDDAATWKDKQIVRSKETYRTSIGPLLARAGTSLRWTPMHADGDGDYGFTTGRWTLHRRDASGGDSIAGSGTYCTIWHRQGDGRWKVVFDIGNDDPK